MEKTSASEAIDGATIQSAGPRSAAAAQSSLSASSRELVPLADAVSEAAALARQNLPLIHRVQGLAAERNMEEYDAS